VYGLRRTSTPDAIISLAELKARLEVSRADQDALLARLLVEATAQAEGECARQFAPASWTATFDGFPPCRRCVALPLAPARSVSAVRYFDALGVSRTMDAGSYYAACRIDPPRLVPASHLDAWPETQPGRPEAVEIDFEAGYASVAAVPPEAVAAVLLIVADRYENRGDESGRAIPPAAHRLLNLVRWGG
jgi:uncharacterized phiE125 gp8 family phage protein